MKQSLIKLRNCLPLLTLSALLALGLAACGQKGGLTRPEQASLAMTFATSHTALTDR